MTFAEDVVDYLAGTTGGGSALGTKGTDLFHSLQPAISVATTPITTLKHAGGIEQNETARKQIELQMVVKAASSEAAWDKAVVMHDALHTMRGITLTTYFVDTSSANSLPQAVGQDDNKNWEYVSNYVFHTRPLTGP